jgi:hypothetical protein
MIFGLSYNAQVLTCHQNDYRTGQVPVNDRSVLQCANTANGREVR